MGLKEPRRPGETGRTITDVSGLGSSGTGDDTTVSLLVCAGTDNQAILLEVMCYNLLSEFGFKGPANQRSFTGSHFREAEYQGMAERLKRHLLAWFGNKRQMAGDLTKKERAALIEFEEMFRDYVRGFEDEARREYEEQRRQWQADIIRLKDEIERLRDQNTSLRIQQLEKQIQESEKKSGWWKDPRIWITIGTVFLSLVSHAGSGSKAKESGSPRSEVIICCPIPAPQRTSFKDAETDNGRSAKAQARKLVEGYLKSQTGDK